MQAYSVTSDGSDFLVLWDSSPTPTGPAKSVMWVVIRADGSLATASAVPLAPGTGFTGATWDSQEYLLFFVNLQSPSWKIDALRVSAAAQPIDSAPWSIEPAALRGWYGAASDGQRHTLVAYQKHASSSDSTSRTRARLVSVDGLLAATCSADSDCESGHCSDGVCCNTDCGPSTSDCQACSVAAGAAKDGTCGIVKSGFECRPAAGTCDVAESCDGVHTSCPADLYQADGTVCSSGSCVAGACVPPGIDAGSDATSDAAADADAAVDASKADSGEADSSTADSGAGGSSDANASDAAMDTSDAATDAAGAGAARDAPLDVSGGCGCRLGGERNAAPWLELLLLGAAIGSSRRRRRRTRRGYIT